MSEGYDGVSRRRAPRKRTFKGAFILFNERKSTMQCTVRDISEIGARLKFSDPQQVPEDFSLLIELDGLEAVCRVAWRSGDQVGVEFMGEVKFSDPTRTQIIYT